MTMKRCSTCGGKKPRDQFYRDRSSKDGYECRCKNCIKIARAKHRKKRAAYKKKYDQQNRGKIAEKRRWYHLRRRYGMTKEQYEEMCTGGCGICGKTDERLYVDHCHKTGRIRGLLCNCCNRGIGFLQDSAEIIGKAKEYLESR